MPATATTIAPAWRTKRRVAGLVALLACVAVAGLLAAPVASQIHPVTEEIDFIRFGGAVYLSSAYLAQDGESPAYHPIDAAALGPPVGRVVTDQTDPTDAAEYPNEPCYWVMPEGTAPRLDPGDPIYAVRGYATAFRLAARRDGDLALYQVWCSEDARVGADLFDIYGRVRRISVTGDVSERSGFAVIEDPATLDALVGMLLAGPVIPEEAASGVPVSYQLIIHLDDGTTFRASTAPGEFLWGVGVVEVPAAFDEALGRAWSRAAGAD